MRRPAIDTATTLDVGRIRRQFDFVDRGRVVTNNAASTQPPRELLALQTDLAGTLRERASRAVDRLEDDHVVVRALL